MSASEGAASDLTLGPLREALDGLREKARGGEDALLSFERPITVARAPARLDLMGGIADYSGSLVLEWPLACATYAAVQPAADDRVIALSVPQDGARPRRFELSVSELTSGCASTYEGARELFSTQPDAQWAAYVFGPLLTLARERGLALSGARIVVTSEVPEGKGVSSSAALEVAVMVATAGTYGLSLSGVETALLCQRAENRVVGAPCGVMDPMTVACGRRGELLALLCQPAEVIGSQSLPKELAVYGIDSGVRHAVTGADYREVRTAAFMGLRILTGVLGRDLGGYLAHLSPSELAPVVAEIPEEMPGADFLDRYGGIADPATRVDASKVYRVRAATEHPVHEHFRVRAFSELLGGPQSPTRAALLGELMHQSHASYSRCGLGSAATDRLVDLVHDAGMGQGLFGAKITGGGSGGTVAVLGRADAAAAVHRVAAHYAEETGLPAHVFEGSSDGALAFGSRTLFLEGGS